MRFGILSNFDGDYRSPITPEVASKWTEHEIIIQSGALKSAGFADDCFAHLSHVRFEKDRALILSICDVILTVSNISKDDVAFCKEGVLWVGILKPNINKIALKSLAERKGTALSLEFLPRITRAQSMDVLSSQNNLAGYRAVLEGAFVLPKVFPLMMTAAGTVAAARVLVLGAGVAGLQAIATAKRLGAVVSAFDVRSASKEQVNSLGATFIEVPFEESGDGQGGYANEMSLAYQTAQSKILSESLKKQDVVITTAQIPGKKAPVLITQAMVDGMKRGSIIIDLSAETGGNCALTVWGEEVDHNGVRILGPKNFLNKVATDASLLYARNLFHFMKLLGVDGTIPEDDELIRAVTLVHKGMCVHSTLTEEA